MLFQVAALVLVVSSTAGVSAPVFAIERGEIGSTEKGVPPWLTEPRVCWFSPH